LTWLIGLGGVHLYSADRLAWIMLFPSAFAGPLFLPLHSAQWIAYAFLVISAIRMPVGRRHLVTLGVVLAAHVGLGLISFELVGGR
jgi:hypothetical protein